MMTEEQMDSPRLTPVATAPGQASRAAPAPAMTSSSPKVWMPDLCMVLINMRLTSFVVIGPPMDSLYSMHMFVRPHYSNFGCIKCGRRSAEAGLLTASAG
jgi:hypothetical protein